VDGASAGGRSLLDLALVRLTLCYVAIAGVAGSALAFLPGLEAALDRERARHVMATSGPLAAPSGLPHASTVELLLSDLWIAAIGSSILALALAIPLAWTYQWTSRKKTYDQGFAQSLVVLPVAITAVVLLVKGSLALAFSLAGIVAAVRFRSQLSGTKDAVFLFVAIAIGLAAGTQLMLVALVASAIANYTLVILVSRDFGRRPRRLDGWVLRPHETKAASSVSEGQSGPSPGPPAGA
jgi:hypothetical protein